VSEIAAIVMLLWNGWKKGREGKERNEELKKVKRGRIENYINYKLIYIRCCCFYCSCCYYFTDRMRRGRRIGLFYTHKWSFALNKIFFCKEIFNFKKFCSKNDKI
jgi:hypothetical protein